MSQSSFWKKNFFYDKKVVIVSGARSHFIEDKLSADLRVNVELDRLDPDVVVQGGATGVDDMARHWAKQRARVSITHFPAWYSRHGSAGPERNIAMLEAWPNALVACFPSQRSVGTRHMIHEAIKRNMLEGVYEIL